MRGGIRFRCILVPAATPPPPLARHLTARVPSRGSSTCQTSHGARTAPTTSRRCACRSTPTAASAGSTFRTGATAEPRTPRSRTAVEPHASRSTRAPAPAPFASVTASFALPNPQPWHVRDASSAQALLRGGAAAGVQALPANPGVARSPERLLRPGARSHASPPPPPTCTEAGGGAAGAGPGGATMKIRCCVQRCLSRGEGRGA